MSRNLLKISAKSHHFLQKKLKRFNFLANYISKKES